MANVTLALIKKAMVEDLSESGVKTRTQLSKIKTKPLLAKDVEKITGIDVPGYEIPYFDAQGRVLKRFKRIKFLAPIPGSPGQKYWQKPETLPHAYLPPITIERRTWESILKNAKIPLYITEGEKKAICACINGLPTIGLGGVWSFKSKKAGQSLIAELQKVNWKEREVHIIFDNDVMVKPDVLRALHTFTSTLRQKGVKQVHHIYLEGEDEEKLGLDDFIVKYGIKKLKKYSTSSSDELLSKLYELNTRYTIMLNHSDKIFNLSTQQFTNVQGFVNVSEAANRVEIIDSSNKPKTVNVAAEWLKWPNRRTLTDVTFAPEEPVITDDNKFNLWKGYPYSPKRGDVSLFNELVDHIFKDATHEEKKWFLQWAAYPLQNPGTKMHSSVLIWGDQGTGKTFLGLILKTLYGEYGRSISHGAIVGDFNEWAAKAQFVLADEAIFHGNRRESAVLKNIITQEHAHVNIKYQPSYQIRDYTNYFFTSNYSDAIYMEPGDRRFLVIHSKDKKLDSFYKALDTWLKNPDSYAAIMHHLVHKVSTKGFSEKQAPPVTVEKKEMIYETMSGIDQVVTNILENPHEFFLVGGVAIERSIFTAEEVYALLPNHVTKITTMVGLSHALRRAGCIRRKITIKGTNGRMTSKRVYVMKDQKKFDRAPAKVLINDYMNERIELKSNIVPFKKKRARKF